MELPRTLPDFQARAEEVLPEGPYGYYVGGAGDEVTLRDNVDAWRRIAVRPRMMVDVSARDPSTTVLGQECPHPIFIAPTAFHALATKEGERATARAAAATGSVMTLSSLATSTPAQVAAAAPDARRFFQLYVFRDRGVSRDLVAQAVEHGFEALVLTVDLPLFGSRDRDRRSQVAIHDATQAPGVGAAAAHTGPISPKEVGDLIDPTLTWPDIEAFAAESGLPVIVKGILEPADARLAADHGAAGIVVSNHGGRQLDTVLSGADALPPIVEEVGDEVDVLVDGGIRRGVDVAKALAMGAKAVMIGRPVLWGLAAGGEEGATAVINLLLEELDVALALLGCPNVRDLGSEHVMPAPWASPTVARRPVEPPA